MYRLAQVLRELEVTEPKTAGMLNWLRDFLKAVANLPITRAKKYALKHYNRISQMGEAAVKSALHEAWEMAIESPSKSQIAYYKEFKRLAEVDNYPTRKWEKHFKRTPKPKMERIELILKDKRVRPHITEKK